MKNMSYNVTAAVAPSGQIEYVHSSPPNPICVQTQQPPSDQTSPQSFPFYKAPINQLCESPLEKTTHRGTTLFPDGLTEQGFFDLKFFHNKLW